MTKTLSTTLAALSLAVSTAGAASLYVVPDVPTDLAGTTYLPSQILRYDTPGYAVALSLPLPPGTMVDGIQRQIGGDWLISVETPTTLGAATFLPNEVIRTNGIVFGSIFCGSVVGVPVTSNIDAVVLDSAGNLHLSFDVPTTIGAATFDPADIVKFARIGPTCGDWAVSGASFDASATVPPVPISSDVTAADFRPPLTVFSFDVPTTLGAATFLPGQIDSWNGAAFGLFEPLAGWPRSSYVNALSLLVGPGTVPVNMRVHRLLLDGSQVQLVWGAGCSAGDEDYGIYEGAIGSWYSHSLVDCNDALGDLMEDIGTTSGDRYYLVTPKNPSDEGSYGVDSAGVQRPVGAPACIPTQVIACP